MVRSAAQYDLLMFGAEIVSFISGVGAGLATNALWYKRHKARILLGKPLEHRNNILGFNPEDVGLFPINRWSPSRPLTPPRLRMKVVAKRPDFSKWIDFEEWQALADDFAKEKDGDIAYLTAFFIDHRESDEGQVFEYRVAHCKYYEHLATVEYLNRHPSVRSRLRAQLLAGHALDLARSSPPSTLKINVAILDCDRHFMAIQRSGAVDFKKGIWTVGPNETMQLPLKVVPGLPGEDFFHLAERCLREEIGLERSDYGDISISWVGYEDKTAAVKVYAQVVTHLSRRDVDEHMAGAHSVFEAQNVRWIPFKRNAVMDIVQNWEHGDSQGRRWSTSAPLALQEMWRMRSRLHLDYMP
jgi:hypothetical protein